MADDQDIQVSAVPVVQQGSSKIHFLLMIVSILVMVLTPLITILGVKMMSKEKEEPKEVQVEALKTVLIEDIQVNVANTQGTRYATMSVVFEVDNQTVADAFAEQGENSKMLRIRAIVLEIISDKPMQTLLAPDGKKMLGKEIRDSLNDMLADGGIDGQIKRVYFTKFLIQ